MKKTKRTMISILTALIVLTSFVGSHIYIKANADLLCNLNNESRHLTTAQAQSIWSEIQQNLLQKYNKNKYTLENIVVTFKDVEETQTSYIVDIDVITDMTLIADPEKSDYILGMKEEIKSITDATAKSYAEQVLQKNLEAAKLTYQVAYRTGIDYRAEITKSEAIRSNAFTLYYRKDITSTETIVSEVPEQIASTRLTKEDGRKVIQISQARAALTRSTSDVSFDDVAAVAYAVANAMEDPEFSTANKKGSDCANFVSKCLHAGGYPIDTPGQWYPSVSGGTASTADAGINWMRTGYNNNGGVVPYMLQKGYLTEAQGLIEVFPSAVMFWNNASHVAMVTYKDTEGNIKYSEHSNVTSDKVYHDYEPLVDNVTFYVPFLW